MIKCVWFGSGLKMGLAHIKKRFKDSLEVRVLLSYVGNRFSGEQSGIRKSIQVLRWAPTAFEYGPRLGPPSLSFFSLNSIRLVLKISYYIGLDWSRSGDEL
jgi:hypothetical protein